MSKWKGKMSIHVQLDEGVKKKILSTMNEYFTEMQCDCAVSKALFPLLVAGPKCCAKLDRPQD